MNKSKKRINTHWWWDIFASATATIIGIGLTFGVQALMQRKQQKQIKHELLISTMLDLTLTLTIYDTETTKVLNLNTAMKNLYDESQDRASAFKTFETALNSTYNIGAFNNPAGEYFTGNLETLGIIDDLKAIEFIQTCYQSKEKYQKAAQEVRSLINECFCLIQNYKFSHPRGSYSDLYNFMVTETDAIGRLFTQANLLINVAERSYSWTEAYMEKIKELTGITQDEIDKARADRATMIKSFTAVKDSILVERRNKRLSR